MRALLAASCLTLMVACSGGSSSPAPTALDIADYKGRWLVVNYWAQWCKPCIKEIPELNALDAKYPQVAVLGVNFDGITGPELEAQKEKLGISFTVLEQDPSGVLGVVIPSVLPATFIVNPDGQLVHSLVGPQTLESLALATGQVGIVDQETSSDLAPD
jgi:thiol-disulfide isomerase/thioredoxin